MDVLTEQWTPNCGAPLDRDKVRAGFTWDAEIKLWVRPEEVGATVTKLDDGWWTFFGLPYHSGKAMVRKFQQDYI